MSGFQIWGIIVLVLFYGIYLWRGISLHRSGYPVFALGRAVGEKERETLRIERLLIASCLLLALIECVNLFINRYKLESAVIRVIGVILCVIGIGCLALAEVAMGKSWRVGVTGAPQRRLAVRGAYAISRNPAVVGFDLFYIGFFLLFANLPHLCLLILSVGLLHMQILEEEKYLRKTFGPDYAAYCHKTARYLIF